MEQDNRRIEGRIHEVLGKLQCAFIRSLDGTKYYMAFDDCAAVRRRKARLKKGQPVTFRVQRYSGLERGLRDRAVDVELIEVPDKPPAATHGEEAAPPL